MTSDGRRLGFGGATFILGVAVACAQSVAINLDDPAIGYMTRPLQDPVAELDRKVLAGQLELRFDDGHGYLRSVLEALDVPVESQMAVFSKTSVQSMRIDPHSPRVLYFNDAVVVGWVPHGSLEIAGLDPRQGIIFYTVDQRPWVHDQRTRNPAARAQSLFQRRTDCLSCHVSKSTHGIPGTLVRSVFPSIDGTPQRQFGVTDTDHRTPFEKLWGGWYVSGTSGSAKHMGNAVVARTSKSELQTLTGAFDAKPYLSPYSDIVALAVFEHQTHMMNLLIETGWRARLGLPSSVDELVDYLLFIDEAPLPAKVEGVSGFAAKFASRGPVDRQGRSLRQLDLERRLLRYPCSYMIYSEAFDALPLEIKNRIYHRVWQILSGEEKGARYARFSTEERKAIVEILRDTKEGLPDYYQK